MGKITLIADSNVVALPPVLAADTPQVAQFRFIGDKPLEMPTWLVKGLLPETGVALLAGQYSSGKTFIGIDLTLSVIYGEPFLGRKTKRGGVLWLAAEGGGELEPRVSAARHGKFGDDSGAPLPLLWRDAVPNGSTDAILAQIKAMIRAADGDCHEAWDAPLRLIVIDTLAAGLALQDENDNAEAARIMKRLGEIANELDVLILLIAHLGKAAENGVRGASAYGAGADAIIGVQAAVDPLSGTVGGRSISLLKTRRGTPGSLSSFDLVPLQIGEDEDRDPIMSCYVSFGDSPAHAKGKPLTRGVKVLLDAINEAMIAHGSMVQTHKDSPPRKAVRIDFVRDEFNRGYVAGDAETKAATKRQAFRRALEAILTGGKIGCRSIHGVEYVWPVQ